MKIFSGNILLWTYLKNKERKRSNGDYCLGIVSIKTLAIRKIDFISFGYFRSGSPIVLNAVRQDLDPVTGDH